MSDWMFWWCVFGTVAVVLCHGYFTTIFFLKLLRPARHSSESLRQKVATERTMIVLCLRGKDPFLAKSIVAASRLNHANYFVRTIIDNVNDPSYALVEGVIKDTGTDLIEVETLRNHLETCSLKCSAIIQALSDIPTDVEYVAFMDADTEPHPEWLNQLLVPLEYDPDIAVTSGNRWYSPNQISMGSMLRYIWNVAAASQMVSTRVPWGGTLAFRRSFVEQHVLVDKLKHAFCEDTMLHGVASVAGKRVHFVPDLLMVNREDCNVSELMPWVRRQLLTVRLHHSAWPIVLSTGVLPLIVCLSVLGYGAVCLIQGYWTPFAAMVLCYGCALIAMFGAVQIAELLVRRSVCRSGRAVHKWLSLRAFWYGFAAICLLQITSPIAMLKAAVMQRVSWRGVSYRIHADNSISMTEYRPFGNVPAPKPHFCSAETIAPEYAVARITRSNSIH